MSRREWNRNAMPTTAQVLDQLQAEFGDDTRLIWAEEGDYEVGTELHTRDVGTTVGGARVSVETGRRRIGPVAQPKQTKEAQ